MTNDLKSALTIVYGDIVAINGKADTNASNIESNTSNIETLQQEVANLKASASGVLYNETEVSGVGYELSVSENALPYGTMDIVGGMSYKCYNLYDKDNYSYQNAYYDSSGNLNTASNTSMNATPISVSPSTQYTFKVNTTIAYFGVCFFNGTTFISRSQSSNTNTLTFTTPNNCNYIYIYANYDGSTTISADFISTIQPMLNEGSTALDYQPYFEGIRNTSITSVISKDSNDNLLATGEIPSEIQALTGYGWGINNTCYNYINLTNKKFILQTGKTLGLTYESNIITATTTGGLTCVVIQTNENLIGNNQDTIVQLNNLGLTAISATSQWNTTATNVIACNNQKRILINFDQSLTDEEMIAKAKTLIFYYKLAEPIETDISSYITDNTMQFGASGTITLNNDYGQKVPYQYTILEKVSE